MVAFVRFNFEYCVQFWAPHNKKYIDAVEKVQRRATIVVPDMKGKSYKTLHAFKFSKKRGVD